MDVRIIAATNRNLEAMVREGRFRDDLFFRLNVFPLILPPLRERPEDLPLLADHFLRTYAAKNQPGRQGPGPGGAPGLPELSLAGEYPGTGKRHRTGGDRLPRGDLDPPGPAGRTCSRPAGPCRDETELELPELERQLISRTLEKVDGQRQAAAEILGISLDELDLKLRAYGLGKG